MYKTIEELNRGLDIGSERMKEMIENNINKKNMTHKEGCVYET